MVEYTIVLLVVILCSAFADAAFNCSSPPIFSNYDINSCCRVPHIDLGNVPHKCTKEIDAIKTHPNFPAFAHVCYPECVYRESGALHNGEIQMDRVRHFLQGSVQRADHEIVPVIIQSFQNCIDTLKGHMSTTKSKMYSKLPEGCSPYSSMVWGCVNTDTFINCPDKMWKKDSECQQARQFVKQCNPLPHVPLAIY